jgi:hypothetical protein
LQVKAIAADIGSGNYDKAKQDFAALLTTLARLISAGLPSGPAKSLDDCKNLFKTLPLPPIADTFQDDTVFADMRVAGPNPLVIVKMTGPIAKFPVTNQQFQSVMGNNDDLGTRGGYASDQTLMPCRPHRWQWDICAYQPTPSSSKPSCAVSSRQSGQKRRNHSGQSRR